MKINKLITKLFMVLTLLVPMALNVSCVGEIEDAAKDSTLTSVYNPGGVFFSGLHSLKAISHNRIEVYFYPAQGGCEKYNYIIHYANASVTVPSDVLTPDYRGLLMHTLTGLDQAYSYTIRMDDEDQETGGKIETNVTLQA